MSRFRVKERDLAANVLFPFSKMQAKNKKRKKQRNNKSREEFNGMKSKRKTLFEDLLEREEDRRDLDLEMAFKKKFSHDTREINFSGLNKGLAGMKKHNMRKFARVSQELEKQMAVHEISALCTLISYYSFI